MADAGYKAKVVRNWTIPQGAYTSNGFRYGITVAGVTTYPALVTDGWVARAQIRNKVGGDVWVELVSSATTGPRIALDDDGYVTLVLPAASTEGWAATRKSGVYDVELVRPDGRVIRLAMGRVTVSPDVTRTEA